MPPVGKGGGRVPDRRRAVRALCVLPLAFAAGLRAQERPRSLRLGCSWTATHETVKKPEAAFLLAMRELGYEQGRNFVFDARYADGDFARVARQVDELIAGRPDILMGIESNAQVMRARTRTIPIVLTVSTDPVAAGLAASLSRPGGNVTGVAFLYAEVGAKLIELMSEVMPRARRFALMLDKGVPGHPHLERVSADAARSRGIALVAYYARSNEEIDAAYESIARDRPDLVIRAGGSGLLYGARHRMIASATRLGLPTVSSLADNVTLGELVGYGPSLAAGMQRAAVYVDKIARGANPAELPIEQATRFELAVNLRVAKALGIAMPASILARADRVLE